MGFLFEIWCIVPNMSTLGQKMKKCLYYQEKLTNRMKDRRAGPVTINPTFFSSKSGDITTHPQCALINKNIIFYVHIRSNTIFGVIKKGKASSQVNTLTTKASQIR